MKALNRILNLTLFWAAAFCSSIAPAYFLQSHTDPTDDFSFSFSEDHGSSSLGGVRFMPVESVAEILSDRLSLFPKSQSPKLADHLVSLCRKHRLDPAFVLSLIQAESEFRIHAVSPVGAIGLMQLMLPTAQALIKTKYFHLTGFEPYLGKRLHQWELTPKQLREPFLNTAIGVAYLAWLRDYYDDHHSYTVFAAYNVGPGRMDELLAQKGFKPVDTKKYFQNIRSKVPHFRFYQPARPRPKLERG